MNYRHFTGLTDRENADDSIGELLAHAQMQCALIFIAINHLPIMEGHIFSEISTNKPLMLFFKSSLLLPQLPALHFTNIITNCIVYCLFHLRMNILFLHPFLKRIN